MKESKQAYEQLKAKQFRNDELQAELNRLEDEISELKQKNETAKHKWNELNSQYTALKQSKEWSILVRLNKLRRIKKVASLLLAGKQGWKQVFSRSWKKKKAQTRIKKLKYNLYELGFTKKAVSELEQIIAKTDNVELKKLAAWELAVWHANHLSKERATQCLRLLPVAINVEQEKAILRRAAILEAECYEIVGEADKGKQVLSRALKAGPHVDLYLAAANLESTASERMSWINKALELNQLMTITLDPSKQQSSYDSLSVELEHLSNRKRNESRAKVSVIIPVYNAEKVVRIAIESMLAQTWDNLELLVVDDCSTDSTALIIEEYRKNDTRVHLLTTNENGGAYAARNLALQHAEGEFVTINDADDWSHPEKIEKQVKHLMENESVIANTSEQARATEDLTFYRRGKPGSYMFANMSSLMFRRKPVMEAIGYWDQVRFGADGEFKKRLKKVFGDEAVVDLKTGPLSFQRQSSTSLTGNQAFGYHGFFMGARKEYFESYRYYHETADSLKYEPKQASRLFPVPEPMWPKREDKPTERRHFDVIIASEFRLLGGTNMSNIEEIKAQKRMGLRTGLIQMARYDFHSKKEINPKVRELIDGDRVQMLVYGEQISCDVLIIRHPPVLQEWQKYIPNVKARSIHVIVNQPPKREYSKKGTMLYDLKQCAGNLHEYFGKIGKWYPIGPLVRQTLHSHHAKELKAIKLANEDWVNIIDVDEWRRTSRPARSSKIKVGRHSRSQYVKWPADRDQLLFIYPDSDQYEIHVLGGAEAPRNVLGQLPSNWYVHEFGEVDPKEFLATLDVFVYYTHPDWVEAFGRVIFEAMAVGVPVIIPPSYNELFGEAAIYAEPKDVQEKIKQLMADDHFYMQQVEKAHAYVDKHFGYTKHASRLKDYIIEPNDYE